MPGECRGVTPSSFAERLHEAIFERLPGELSEHAKPLHLSVKRLVDRTRIELVTSAVQRRRSPI